MNSILLNGYNETGFLPPVDELLDWRLRLKELQKTGEYPPEWYEVEIKATDELLAKHDL